LSEEDKDELAELIRQMLAGGQIDPASLSKLSGLGANPALFTELFEQARFLMEPGAVVNWELARAQAERIAKGQQKPANPVLDEELRRACGIAAMWLQEVTEFSNPNQVKIFSRELWTLDSLPLFSRLGTPVAAKTSKTLAENLESFLPEEMKSVLQPAAHFIQNAGAAIFATQLGVVIGQLSEKVLTAGEIGIPVIDRPGFVSQNVDELLTDLETPKSELLLFLALRELAISSLFNSNRYLADQITAQVIEFASGLKVELGDIQEMMQQVDPQSPESVNRILEASGSFAIKTPEQEIVLERIQILLALVEGFADALAAQAGKRLPNLAAAAEILARRRATAMVAERTFQVLVGLELSPRLIRDAKAMWEMLSKEQRDALWRHPDQLPSREEIENPEALITRLRAAGDDLDGELRKLLDQ
jgi:putative hydrolase